jgi:hypothetical protein
MSPLNDFDDGLVHAHGWATEPPPAHHSRGRISAKMTADSPSGDLVKRAVNEHRDEERPSA